MVEEKRALGCDTNIYVVNSISFQPFFVQTFKIVVDSSKSSMLLLYILWDDWPIFMISSSNEQLQQQFQYTLTVRVGEFQKCNLDESWTLLFWRATEWEVRKE